MNIVLYALLAWHIIFCIVYVILGRGRKLYMALLPVVVLVPYLSLMILGFLFLYAKAKRKVRHYDEDEVFRKTRQMEYVSEINRDKEKNIVPVEEALIVNNHLIQRQMVMEIAKRSPDEYLDELKSALLSEDTETAHYAASSITELKRIYDKEVISAQRLYEENPESRIARNAYIRALDNMISSKLNIETINSRYIHRIVQVLEEDIEKSEIPAEESFEKLVEYLVDNGNYEQAESWLQKYHDRYSRSDNMLRIQLDIAYKMKDKKRFNQAIDEINSAEFVVTQKTRDMVNFWQNRQMNEREATST